MTAERVEVPGSSFSASTSAATWSVSWVLTFSRTGALAPARYSPATVRRHVCEALDGGGILVEVEPGAVRRVRDGAPTEDHERDRGVAGREVGRHLLGPVGDPVERVGELAVRPVGAQEDRVRDVEHEDDVRGVRGTRGGDQREAADGQREHEARNARNHTGSEPRCCRAPPAPRW